MYLYYSKYITFYLQHSKQSWIHGHGSMNHGHNHWIPTREYYFQAWCSSK